VKQAGSLVAPDRLRFDFIHFSPISPEELTAIEDIVNTEVMRNTAVQTTVRATDEAMALGAMALFGEKYGDQVRVVDIPGFSLELCGGTHCGATGEIGPFTIVSEGGVAAGIRRIEALTGSGALARLHEDRRQLALVADELKTTAAQAPDAVARLQAELKRLQKELHETRMKAAMGTPASTEAAQNVDGVALQTRRVDGLDRAGLRELADQIKQQLGSGVVVLAAQADDKVALVVSVTRDLTPRVKAGDLVKRLAPIVGGGGGGRPDFAEAGGRQPEHIDQLLAEAPSALAALLGSGL
jgi:alanyl-tRNA synthetase